MIDSAVSSCHRASPDAVPLVLAPCHRLFPDAVPLVLDATTFAVLVWGTVALVLLVFGFVVLGVVRAGGIDLQEDSKER